MAAMDVIKRKVYHNGLPADAFYEMEKLLTKEMSKNYKQKTIHDYFK